MFLCTLQKNKFFRFNVSTELGGCIYKVQPEVGICHAIIAAQACGATILLAIALAPQLFLNGRADACAASISAILRAIAIQIDKE